MKIGGAIVTIFVQFPIWFYLVYTLLASVETSSLTWFLFWIYIPASVFSHMLVQLGKQEK